MWESARSFSSIWPRCGRPAHLEPARARRAHGAGGRAQAGGRRRAARSPGKHGVAGQHEARRAVRPQAGAAAGVARRGARAAWVSAGGPGLATFAPDRACQERRARTTARAQPTTPSRCHHCTGRGVCQAPSQHLFSAVAAGELEAVRCLLGAQPTAAALGDALREAARRGHAPILELAAGGGRRRERSGRRWHHSPAPGGALGRQPRNAGRAAARGRRGRCEGRPRRHAPARATRGDPAIIQALLAAGAAADAINGEGTTPLTAAACHGHLAAASAAGGGQPVATRPPTMQQAADMAGPTRPLARVCGAGARAARRERGAAAELVLECAEEGAAAVLSRRRPGEAMTACRCLGWLPRLGVARASLALGPSPELRRPRPERVVPRRRGAGRLNLRSRAMWFALMGARSREQQLAEAGAALAPRAPRPRGWLAPGPRRRAQQHPGPPAASQACKPGRTPAAAAATCTARPSSSIPARRRPPAPPPPPSLHPLLPGPAPARGRDGVAVQVLQAG